MASFAQPNTYINTLISAGADAMKNLYYIEFTGSLIDNDENTKVGLTVRNRDFSFPGLTHGTDTQSFMTVSVDFPKAEITGDKTLTLNFRVDSNWDAYKYLLKQQAVTSVANLGFAANDVPKAENGGVTINVYALDDPITDKNQLDPDAQKTNFKKMYEFKYCWVKSLTGLTFSYNNATPQTVSASIGFWDFKDPQNLL